MGSEMCIRDRVGSIGAGLVFSRLLTDKDWALGRLIDFDKKIPQKPSTA
mgnify:CR=1 FL=1